MHGEQPLLQHSSSSGWRGGVGRGSSVDESGETAFDKVRLEWREKTSISAWRATRGAVCVDCRRRDCRASHCCRILNDLALEKSSDLLATILVRSVPPASLANWPPMPAYFDTSRNDVKNPHWRIAAAGNRARCNPYKKSICACKCVRNDFPCLSPGSRPFCRRCGLFRWLANLARFMQTSRVACN